MNEPVKQLSQNDQIQSLLLPLGEKWLLLPNVSVAEIVSGLEVHPIEGQPDWCLGSIDWRGESIPLVAFDRLNGDADELTEFRQIAVINAISGRAGLDFFAMAIAGVPRQLRIIGDELNNDEHFQPGAAELSRVRVAGVATAIPNLDYIEERLFSFGLA